MSNVIPIESYEACWSSIDELLDELTGDQWETSSLCEGWTVRDVVTHLGAVEHMMSAEVPGSFTDGIPFDKVVRWMEDVKDLDDAALIERYRAVIAARRAELATYGPEVIDVPSMTPVGPKTYGRFLAIRVFDFWVHEQDMRVPLGLPGHEGGPAAELALDEIELSLPYIVGKKIGLPDGMGITIDLTGPVERTMHVKVDGRAGNVDSLDDPDVVLRADSLTFALLACGRIDPQRAIDEGRITWAGDDTWGEAAASNLAFTM
ncbi:MAG: maleylpyruvate isomerase family mycothiol-dependent enzyme [Acidimicrobiia bacterium]|nr:maleylpyruvate isomerase family mycothiol-dependent enzyme [Acidimicrobiia bacterium]